jgi:hypothetical protein
MIKIEISDREGILSWGTPDGPSRPDWDDDTHRVELTYRCFVPSNRLDFLMAYNSSPPPFRCTLMTFPNSPLPTSSISTKSRSNLPGCSSAKESDNRRLTRAGLGPRCRGASDDGTVGELIVAIELDDDPEKDRGDDTLIALLDGESPGGILGLGRCQSVGI